MGVRFRLSNRMSRLITTAVRRLALRPICPVVTKVQTRTFFNKKGEEPGKPADAGSEADTEPVNAAELDETKKDHRYKLSDLSMELKAQQDRFNREIEKTKATGIKSFAKSLFPVADQFSLAFDAVSADSLSNNEEL